MTIPTQGQGSFAVNVEHTRDVHYVIEMTKTETTFVDAKNLITKSIVLPVLEGVLAAGTDDIPNATPDMVFDANTDSITVDVQLDEDIHFRSSWGAGAMSKPFSL
jgi:hypothetical protein